VTDVHERLSRLETKLERCLQDLARLEREVRGNGVEKSIRARLHKLETDRVAVRAAVRARSEAQAALAAAEEAKELRGERKWTRRQLVITTIVGFVTLVPALVLPWVNLYLGLSHR
jgi:hypothetical protein